MVDYPEKKREFSTPSKSMLRINKERKIDKVLIFEYEMES